MGLNLDFPNQQLPLFRLASGACSEVSGCCGCLGLAQVSQLWRNWDGEGGPEGDPFRGAYFEQVEAAMAQKELRLLSVVALV